MSPEEAVKMLIRVNATSDFIDNNPDFVKLMTQPNAKISTTFT
jgi:translation elongation factor EF-Ts